MCGRVSFRRRKMEGLPEDRNEIVKNKVWILYTSWVINNGEYQPIYCNSPPGYLAMQRWWSGQYGDSLEGWLNVYGDEGSTVWSVSVTKRFSKVQRHACAYRTAVQTNFFNQKQLYNSIIASQFFYNSMHGCHNQTISI